MREESNGRSGQVSLAHAGLSDSVYYGVGVQDLLEQKIINSCREMVSRSTDVWLIRESIRTYRQKHIGIATYRISSV